MRSRISTIGTPVARIEGPDKVTGRARYTADVHVRGMLFGAVLRSPSPHARIVNIDTGRARALDGVRAVLTGRDVRGRRWGRSVIDLPFLAYDRVRYIGEPVAAVAADDPDIAEEALELIDVEYEALPAVFDPFEAMQPAAPLLHPHFRDYEGIDPAIPDVPNLCCYYVKSKGNVEQGFREADLIVEHSYRTPMQYQAHIEPHSALVSVAPDGTTRIWASSKHPFVLRDMLARDLDLPPEVITVQQTFVGGDFGAKGWHFLASLGYFLSRSAGRPVQLVLSSVEEFMAANPRHSARITIRTGLKREGTIVARHVKLVFSGGAYAGCRPTAGGQLPSVLHHALGVYRTPHTRCETFIAYTNHVPGGFMRAPGGAQAAFACEVDIDRLAEAVGMGPLDFRLQNAVREGELGPLGEHWDDIPLERCLMAVRDASGWGQPKPASVGRGVAVCEHGTGPGGSSARIEVHADGTATLITGVNDPGVGAHTILVQIVANELQLSLDRVRLERADTSSDLWDSGTSAVRVTNVAGKVVLQAVAEVREKLTALAADSLGCPASRIDFSDGVFRDRDRPSAALGFDDLVANAATGNGPVASGYGHYLDWKRTHAASFGALVVEVQVDPETGEVHVRRVWAASEVGTVLNLLGVTGQLDGGLIMALGTATMEELCMSDGRIETVGLHDYKIPCMADVPRFEHQLFADGRGPGPYGAKACADVTMLPLPAAIANAVYDAVGVHVDELPITAERVHRALQAKPQRERAAGATPVAPG